jgi:EAL domain-containing protein (putative c-di-GMP-specific phosphodiesterase class I)
VRSLGGDKGSLEIVRSVVGLGKALGMNVLAEGVETAEQLAILQSEGCDELQGYLFGKPLPLSDAQRVIEVHHVADSVPSTGRSRAVTAGPS